MNTTDKRTKPNYKDFINDKDYFSAYLNMARHNAYITVAHISHLLGGKPSGDDAKIMEMKAMQVLQGTDNIEKQKCIRQLNKHFKFLPAVVYYEKLWEKKKAENRFDILDSELDTEESFDLQDSKQQLSEGNIYYSVLSKLFEPLNDLRNFYTHYYHPVVVVPNYVFGFMNKIFDASVRICKQRFGYNEKDIKHLRRYDGSETDSTGKRMPKENPRFFFKINEPNGTITEKGLAFYICLFLEKKYASNFLKKLTGFKDARTADKQSTFEVYTALRMHLPKQRIRSEETKLGIALDMLNELQKCPDELYELLSDENQDKFRVEVTMRSDADDYEENGLFKRFDNRFPYFALKYFDFRAGFPIRFHVDMGKYYFKFYEKKLVNGSTEIRKLDKDLRAFGRIAELDEYRKNEWAELIKANPVNTENFDFDTATSDKYQPYIQDTYPHYHIEDNQIGLKFTEVDIVPEINAEKTRNQKPDAYLSTYELAGMFFYDWLNKNKEQSASAVLLKEYYDKVRKLFEDIGNDTIKPINFQFTANANDEIWQNELKQAKIQANEIISKSYNIDIHNLPEIIQRHLIGLSIIKDDAFKIYAVDRINKMLGETESRLKKLDKGIRIANDKKIKFGSKRFKEIKSGVLADFLAKDLIRFQPTEQNGKDKITGLNFQILQAHLATFNENKHLLPSIFKECKLTDSVIQHPFLFKLNPSKHLDHISFCKAYLVERKFYLQKCLKEAKFNSYYFLQQKRKNLNERKQSNFIKNVTKKYLNEHPINFPRGLFCEAIRSMIKKDSFSHFKNLNPKASETSIRNFLELTQNRTNTVFLIQKYFELLRGDESQEFYQYERSYKFINQLYDRRDRNQMTKELPQLFYPVKDVVENGRLITEGLVSIVDKLKKDIKKLPPIPQTIKSLRFGEKPPMYKESMMAQYNQFKKNEAKLRLYKVQDMLILLIAEHLLELENINIPSGLFLLKNILPPDLVNPVDDKKNILNYPVRYPINLQFKNLPVATIYQNGLKIKNVGDFVRFTRDRRIEGLLDWYRIDYFKPKDANGNIVVDKKGKHLLYKGTDKFVYEINRLFIENEFSVYEKLRIVVLQNVLTFEKVMHDLYKPELIAELAAENVRLKTKFDAEEAEKKANAESKGEIYIVKQYSEIKYFDFKVVTNVFYNKYHQFTHERDAVVHLRNKFAHNEFPEKSVLTQLDVFQKIVDDYPNSIEYANEKQARIDNTPDMPDDEKRIERLRIEQLRSITDKIAQQSRILFEKYIAEIKREEISAEAETLFNTLIKNLNSNSLAKISTAIQTTYPAENTPLTMYSSAFAEDSKAVISFRYYSDSHPETETTDVSQNINSIISNANSLGLYYFNESLRFFLNNAQPEFEIETINSVKYPDLGDLFNTQIIGKYSQKIGKNNE